MPQLVLVRLAFGLCVAPKFHAREILCTPRRLSVLRRDQDEAAVTGTRWDRTDQGTRSVGVTALLCARRKAASLSANVPCAAGARRAAFRLSCARRARVPIPSAGVVVQFGGTRILR